MKKILLVCYGGGHVKIMAPLYLELIKKYNVEFLALTTAGAYLEKKGIPYKTFASYPGIQNELTISYGKELLSELEGQNQNKDESIAYLGISFSELVDKEGSYEKAKEEYRLKGRSIFLPINCLDKILSISKPDLIITTNVARAELAALKAAKMNSVKSICINDNLWIKGGVDRVAKEQCSDYICVLSEGVKKEILKNSDYPKERVVVTGTPVFDDLKKLSNAEKTNNNTIMLADCELPESSARFPLIRGDKNFEWDVRYELNKLALELGWNVIFRPHPNQKVDYSDYDNIKVSKDENLHALLQSVDVVVTAISTVGLEGKILGCRLVSLEETVYSEAGSYEKLGLSTGVSRASELENAITYELLKEPSGDQDIYYGNSVSNIKKLINNILVD